MKAKTGKRIRAENAGDFIRTTAALPPALHTRLLHASADTHMVGTEILRRALEEWLTRHDRKMRRAGK